MENWPFFNYRKCLKSKLLKSEIWIQIYDISQKCLKYESESSDFRHILKKCLKTELWALISDIHCKYKAANPNSYFT